MATHSRILAWRIPWTEEPGGLWSIGSQRVRHDSKDLAHVFGRGTTKGVIQSALKITGGKNLQFQSPLLFFFVDRPCALLWGWLADSGKEKKGEFLAKGTAAALIFNRETNGKGIPLPLPKWGAGETQPERGSGLPIWTVSGRSLAPFTDTFFFSRFLDLILKAVQLGQSGQGVVLWTTSRWWCKKTSWQPGPSHSPHHGSPGEKKERKRLYSQQFVSVGAERSAGRFSFTSSMHSGFSKERSVREVLSENKMPRLYS